MSNGINPPYIYIFYEYLPLHIIYHQHAVDLGHIDEQGQDTLLKGKIIVPRVQLDVSRVVEVFELFELSISIIIIINNHNQHQKSQVLVVFLCVRYHF